MREGKPPIGPHSKGLVSANLRKLVAENFEELAHRPTAPPPRSDLDLPESVQDITTMDDEYEFDFEQCCLDRDDAGGFNPWRVQMAHVTSAVPIAPSTRESITCATAAAGACRCNCTHGSGINYFANFYGYDG
jgi:hypothetical protein